MSPVRSTLCILALCLSGCGGSGTGPASAPPPPTNGGTASSVTLSPHLLVDQFGYRNADPKVAVIRNPQVGYDRGEQFTPGPRYEVRRASDGAVVFWAAPAPWHGGAPETSSGDTGLRKRRLSRP